MKLKILNFWEEWVTCLKGNWSYLTDNHAKKWKKERRIERKKKEIKKLERKNKKERGKERKKVRKNYKKVK